MTTTSWRTPKTCKTFGSGRPRAMKNFAGVSMLLSSEPPLGSLILGHVFCSGTSQHCDLGSRSPSPRPLTEKNAPSCSGHFLLQAKKKAQAYSYIY